MATVKRARTKVIRCASERADLDNDRGGVTQGIRVTCGECGHSVESFGTSERSEKRCLVLLKQECGCGDYFALDENGSSAEASYVDLPSHRAMYEARKRA